jgi:hypothetical protein
MEKSRIRDKHPGSATLVSVGMCIVKSRGVVVVHRDRFYYKGPPFLIKKNIFASNLPRHISCRPAGSRPSQRAHSPPSFWSLPSAVASPCPGFRTSWRRGPTQRRSQPLTSLAQWRPQPPTSHPFQIHDRSQ